MEDFAPAYLRPYSAARYIGISRSLLDSWLKEGRIRPPYRPSKGVVLFERTRLLADIDALCGHERGEKVQEKGTNELDEVLSDGQ